MNFELTLLGTGAALPAAGRFPSAHLLALRGMRFLIDCGEGAQWQLSRFVKGQGKISRIFISHLHGDHCYGLPGLITSFQLQGRQSELHIYAPEGLETMVRTVMRASHARETYPIHFHVLEPGISRRVWEDDAIEVHSLPLRHRVPCCGFLFREKPHLRTLRPGVVEEWDIPYTEILRIKAGNDLVREDGTVIDNGALTLPPPASRSFAYCCDTAYQPGLASYLEGADLLYHDATFCDDLTARAAETGHSTARQAARLARDAGVGRLVLGHFSSRYPDSSCFVREAREVFPDTIAGEDGMKIEIPYAGRAAG